MEHFPQVLQGRTSPEVEPCFLRLLFSLMASVLLFSNVFMPLEHNVLQGEQSKELVSQEVMSVSQALSFVFKVSLKLLQGLPSLQWSSFSWPYSSVFGILLSVMRTCPVKCCWHWISRLSMLGRQLLSRTWSLETQSCRFMPMIFRRHL